MTLKTVEQEWNYFASMVFDESNPQIQRTEMKKAFFAGAWAVMRMTQEIGEPHISEQEGCDHLDAVLDECNEFARSVLRKHGERN